MTKTKFNALKNAIREGIDSGVAENFDPEKYLTELKIKKHNGLISAND